MRISLAAVVCLLFSGVVMAEPYDGDNINGNRLFGLDAPELRQQCEYRGECYPCGRQARNALRRMITDTPLCIRVDRDRYGRDVLYCTIDGTDLALSMIEQGHAVALRRYLHLRPDLKERYLSAETDAKTNERGIWRGRFIEPWEWRRGKRLSCEH